jgi:hypothetical protein
VLGLVFGTRPIFLHFTTKIPTKPKVFSTNRDMLLIDNLAVLDKVPTFRFPMAQIGRNPCAKMAPRISIIANFSAFERTSAAFSASG